MLVCGLRLFFVYAGECRQDGVSMFFPAIPGFSASEMQSVRARFGTRLLGGGVRDGRKFVEVTSDQIATLGDPTLVFLDELRADADEPVTRAKPSDWGLGHLANLSGSLEPASAEDLLRE